MNRDLHVNVAIDIAFFTSYEGYVTLRRRCLGAAVWTRGHLIGGRFCTGCLGAILIKNLVRRIRCSYENNVSVTEIEAGCMQKEVLSCRFPVDEN